MTVQRRRVALVAPAALTTALVLLTGGASPQTGVASGGAVAGAPGGSVARLAAPSLPRRPLVRLAVAGDVGTGSVTERRTVTAMVEASRRFPYDAVPLLGDLVYPAGDPRQVERKVLRPFTRLTRRGAELVPALGNHDYGSGRPDALMRRLGRAHRHYVERVGPVRLVVLDSNRVTPRQTRWLRGTLRRTPAGVRWTIATMHHPAYSGGFHGSTLAVRRAWSPLFSRFHVPLVLAGHDHDYQRTREIRGVTYVVSGGGAKTRPTGRAPFTVVARAGLHFVDVAVYRERLLVRAITQRGHVVDRFVVRHR
jgi:3',5'-cyclic AMP phosphodiesterase CpdA